MLVIERKTRQRFVIGPDIVIEIQVAHRGKARIAISAPKNVSILREELLSREAMADAVARAKEGHTPCQRPS